jgi:hypothetical protein
VAFDERLHVRSPDPDEASIGLESRELSSLDEPADRVLAEATEGRGLGNVNPAVTVVPRRFAALYSTNSR